MLRLEKVNGGSMCMCMCMCGVGWSLLLGGEEKKMIHMPIKFRKRNPEANKGNQSISSTLFLLPPPFHFIAQFPYKYLDGLKI